MAPTQRHRRVVLPRAARGRIDLRAGLRVRAAWAPVVVLVGVAGLSIASARAAAPAPPTFEDPEPAVSESGALQLGWSDDLGRYEVELQHGDTRRIVYRGRMPSAHVSGLPDGAYSLRVRAHHEGTGWTTWSDPKPLTVRHHSMSMVLVLMSLGLVTFAATAGVVLRAAWSPATDDGPDPASEPPSKLGGPHGE